MTRYRSLALILKGIPGCPDDSDSILEVDSLVRCLRRAPHELLNLKEWNRLADLLCCDEFLEAKVDNGLVFELCADFDRAVQAMPIDHPRRRILHLLRKALEGDAEFIQRHPETLFQCMWNRCWWYDSPKAASFYRPSQRNGESQMAPWETAKPKISTLMEAWHRSKMIRQPGFFWLQSLRPPIVPLGSGQRGDIHGEWEISNPMLKKIKMIVDLASDERRPVGEKRSYGAPIKSVSHGNRLLVEWKSWEPVHLIDRVTGAKIADLDIGEDESAQAVAFSRDGSRLAIAVMGLEHSGELQIWGINRIERTICIDIPEPVWATTFSPDGTLVASGQIDGKICIWQSATGKLMASFQAHEDPVSNLSFSEDAVRIISSSSFDHTIRVWDWQNLEPRLDPITVSDYLTDVCLSKDTSRLVTRHENGSTYLWDGMQGALVRCLHENNFRVMEGGHARNAIFLDEHRVICLGARDPGIRIWNALSGDQISSADGEFFLSERVRFSPSGNRVAGFESFYGSDRVRILSLPDGHRVAQFEGHAGSLNDACFSPDGTLFSTASEDSTVRLWNLQSCEQVACCRGHNGPVLTVRFSHDGTYIASGGKDGTVRIWASRTGIQRACFNIAVESISDNEGSRNGQKEYIKDAAFSFDDRQVVVKTRRAGGSEAEAWVRFLDIDSGTCCRTIQGDVDLVTLTSGLGDFTMICGHETRIESRKTNETVAWYPAATFSHNTASAARIFAGWTGRNALFHLKLQGENP